MKQAWRCQIHFGECERLNADVVERFDVQGPGIKRAGTPFSALLKHPRFDRHDIREFTSPAHDSGFCDTLIHHFLSLIFGRNKLRDR
jgi:hypothetical protein